MTDTNYGVELIRRGANKIGNMFLLLLVTIGYIWMPLKYVLIFLMTYNFVGWLIILIQFSLWQRKKKLQKQNQ